MDKLMYLELAKQVIWGIVMLGSVYMICSTIRINKARELKAEMKIHEKED